MPFVALPSCPSVVFSFSAFTEVSSLGCASAYPAGVTQNSSHPPRGLFGLSRLSVWWLKLGILPERIEPAHPEQNGRHERMHRTLKAETTRPAGASLLQQQERFDSFRREYNQERPH